MKKILIASHGKLASGMKSSTNILLGNTDQIYTIDAYLDNSNVEELVNEFFKGVDEDDQVIMMSDIYGGSVNQILYKYINKKNTFLISGINLAILLEIATSEEISPIRIDEIIAEANKYTMRVVDKEIEEEEFF